MFFLPARNVGPPKTPPEIYRYLIAVAVVAVTSLAMFGFRSQFGLVNITFVFLLISLVLGLTVGPKPAAMGAVLAFVLFDYVFIPPYYSLTIGNRDHVLGFIAFLTVALATALLVGRVQQATESAIRESRRTTLLYELNRRLVSDTALEPLLKTIVRSVVDVYGSASCRILLVDAGNSRLVPNATWPESTHPALDRQAAAMAQHVLDSGKPAGVGGQRRRIIAPHGTAKARGHHIDRKTSTMYVPIAVNARQLGVLEVTGKSGSGSFTAEDEQLLTSFADQVALAMERTRLLVEATRANALEQSDSLKSSLLAAVSHDLRTPLTAIKASSSALLDSSVTWNDDARNELLTGIDLEADRLALMVSNLLDLSRIEGGALRPDMDWQDIHELVRDVQTRVATQTRNHTLRINLPSDLPVVLLDYVQISQVLINLIGNAAKYSPAGTTITVAVNAEADQVRFTVSDTGPGIPRDIVPHIFEAFYRGRDTGTVSGSGIGLAICHGLVEAHGGRIWVAATSDQGTTIAFQLPLGQSSSTETAPA